MPKAQVSRLSETALRQVYCPRCQAKPGAMCVDRSGKRKLVCHSARQRYAQRLQDGLPTSRPPREDLVERYEYERTFPCGDCGAAPGEKCRGKRQPTIESTHRSRQVQGNNPHVTD